MKLKVADFIKKPFDSYIVRQRVDNIVELYQHKYNLEMLVSRQTGRLEEQNIVLKKQTKLLQEINSIVIDTMSNLVEFRDLESGQHIKRIKMFSKCLATDEYEVMKSHTIRGCEIVNTIMKLQGPDFYQYSYDVCRHHHEKYDGKGYPDGLVGDNIPIAAQIVSLADVYDALISERIYKEAYDPQSAYQMICNGECGMFSPKIMKCLSIVKPEFEKMAMQYSDE